MSYHEGELIVHFRPPMGLEKVGFAMRFSPEEWARIFAPLSRYRELPWYPEEQARAAQQSETRRQATERLGQMIAASLLKSIESTDPQFGFSPEEWQKMDPRSKS